MLILNDNGLSDKGLCNILNGLWKQGTLESINISNNQIGKLSLEKLNELFLTQPIQELRLSQLGQYSKNTCWLTELMKSIGISSTSSNEGDLPDYALLVLKLNDMNFSDKATFPLLKECLMKNTVLRDLNLSTTMISSKELAELTELLKESMNIKWFDISNNYLSFTNEANKEYNE